MYAYVTDASLSDALLCGIPSVYRAHQKKENTPTNKEITSFTMKHNCNVIMFKEQIVQAPCLWGGGSFCLA